MENPLGSKRQPEFEGQEMSIKLFGEGARNDPSFSQTCSRLANVLLGLSGDTLPHGEAFSCARGLIAKALELDPNSSEAHTARGNLALQSEQDWAVPEREFERAIPLDPSGANAHYWYAWLLTWVGRYNDAKVELRVSTELDPLWAYPRWRLGNAEILRGDFADQLRQSVLDRRPLRCVGRKGEGTRTAGTR